MLVNVKPYTGRTAFRLPWTGLATGGQTKITDEPLLEVTFLYDETSNTQLFTEDSFIAAYEKIIT